MKIWLYLIIANIIFSPVAFSQNEQPAKEISDEVLQESVQYILNTINFTLTDHPQKTLLQEYLLATADDGMDVEEVDGVMPGVTKDPNHAKYLYPIAISSLVLGAAAFVGEGSWQAEFLGATEYRLICETKTLKQYLKLSPEVRVAKYPEFNRINTILTSAFSKIEVVKESVEVKKGTFKFKTLVKFSWIVNGQTKTLSVGLKTFGRLLGDFSQINRSQYIQYLQHMLVLVADGTKVKDFIRSANLDILKFKEVNYFSKNVRKVWKPRVLWISGAFEALGLGLLLVEWKLEMDELDTKPKLQVQPAQLVNMVTNQRPLLNKYIFQRFPAATVALAEHLKQIPEEMPRYNQLAAMLAKE